MKSGVLASMLAIAIAGAPVVASAEPTKGSDAASYAAREAADKTVADFQGGASTTVVIGTSALTLVLIIILIVILL